jgi:hypothetical protein
MNKFKQYFNFSRKTRWKIGYFTTISVLFLFYLKQPMALAISAFTFAKRSVSKYHIPIAIKLMYEWILQLNGDWILKLIVKLLSLFKTLAEILYGKTKTTLLPTQKITG